MIGTTIFVVNQQFNPGPEIDRSTRQRTGIWVRIEHPDTSIVRVCYRSTRGELNDEVGSLTHSRHRLFEPAKIQRRGGIFVADMYVDQRCAGGFTRLGGAHQLVQRHRKSRRIEFG